MNKLIVTIVICVFVVLLACLFSGCSLLKPRTPATTMTEEPPTPAKQLWTAAKKSNWLVTLSILGVAAGVFALVNGAAKLGIASIASASVSLFMALAVARFALWMAVFGLIGSIVAALFSILVRRKALVEIIKGVQKFKLGEKNSSNTIPGTLLRNELKKQSPTTKTIVGNIKNELKLAGKI